MDESTTAQEDYDVVFCNRMKKIVDTRPINFDGIMDVVEQIAHMAEYGVSTDQICKWLKGIWHGDNSSSTTESELSERIVLSDEVINVSKFWNRVLCVEMGSRNTSK